MAVSSSTCRGLTIYDAVSNLVCVIIRPLLLRGSWLVVRGSWFVPRTSYLVPQTSYLKPQTSYLLPPQQRRDQRVLRVHPVLGLVHGDAPHAVQHPVSHFDVAARRQAVHEGSVVGLAHQ